jgi:predicted RNA binding protein YcfA (HicA-like mRNA interferase family)
MQERVIVEIKKPGTLEILGADFYNKWPGKEISKEIDAILDLPIIAELDEMATHGVGFRELVAYRTVLPDFKEVQVISAQLGRRLASKMLFLADTKNSSYKEILEIAQKQNRFVSKNLDFLEKLVGKTSKACKEEENPNRYGVVAIVLQQAITATFDYLDRLSSTISTIPHSYTNLKILYREMSKQIEIKQLSKDFHRDFAERSMVTEKLSKKDWYNFILDLDIYTGNEDYSHISESDVTELLPTISNVTLDSPSSNWKIDFNFEDLEGVISCELEITNKMNPNSKILKIDMIHTAKIVFIKGLFEFSRFLKETMKMEPKDADSIANELSSIVYRFIKKQIHEKKIKLGLNKQEHSLNSINLNLNEQETELPEREDIEQIEIEEVRISNTKVNRSHNGQMKAKVAKSKLERIATEFRIRGSHHVYTFETENGNFTYPVPIKIGEDIDLRYIYKILDKINMTWSEFLSI